MAINRERAALIVRLEAILRRPDLTDGEREETELHIRNLRTILRRRMLHDWTPTHRPN